MEQGHQWGQGRDTTGTPAGIRPEHLWVKPGHQAGHHGDKGGRWDTGACPGPHVTHDTSMEHGTSWQLPICFPGADCGREAGGSRPGGVRISMFGVAANVGAESRPNPNLKPSPSGGRPPIQTSDQTVTTPTRDMLQRYLQSDPPQADTLDNPFRKRAHTLCAERIERPVDGAVAVVEGGGAQSRGGGYDAFAIRELLQGAAISGEHVVLVESVGRVWGGSVAAGASRAERAQKSGGRPPLEVRRSKGSDAGHVGLRGSHVAETSGSEVLPSSAEDSLATYEPSAEDGGRTHTMVLIRGLSARVGVLTSGYCYRCRCGFCSSLPKVGRHSIVVAERAVVRTPERILVGHFWSTRTT